MGWFWRNKCNKNCKRKFCSVRTLFTNQSVYKCNVSVKSKLQHPPPEGIWLSESSRGWGIWSPCVRGGEFELHPRFHVKFLAWRAIIGDAVLEDFRGKIVPYLKVFVFNIFNVGFRLWIYECIKLCLQWNKIRIPAIQYNNKKLNVGQLLWPRFDLILTSRKYVN